MAETVWGIIFIVWILRVIFKDLKHDRVQYKLNKKRNLTDEEFIATVIPIINNER